MIFFAGGNFPLCVFIQTLGALFFILAGYSSRSPYADLGAERETVQVMSYEPMVLLVAIGMFMATGSFAVADLLSAEMPLVRYLPLIFIGFLTCSPSSFASPRSTSRWPSMRIRKSFAAS